MVKPFLQRRFVADCGPFTAVARMRDYVLLYVNGKRHEVRGSAAFAPLADFLRAQLRLVGTKICCAEGDCGACTVMVGTPETSGMRFHTITSCIHSVFQCDGKAVITIEGLAADGSLSPVQQAMVDHHGSQCGFCTPGFVMALTQALQDEQPVDEAALLRALAGNLCRCTGYVPILEAGLAADGQAVRALRQRFSSAAMRADLEAHAREPVCLDARNRGDSATDARVLYYSPRRLEDALAFKARHPDAVIVAGGTELGFERNKRGSHPPKLLAIAGVEGLSQMTREGQTLTIGANVTWAQLEDSTRAALPELHEMTRLFASPQIRSVATLVGNVVHGSPVADSASLLMITDAEIELASLAGTRRVAIGDFYKGFKRVDCAPDEIATHVRLRLPAEDELWRLYKISKRKEMDITTFRAGIRIAMRDGLIARAQIAYSGGGPTVRRLTETEAFLAGKPLTEQTFRAAGANARAENERTSELRGARDYRLLLAENILLKFYFDCISAQRQETQLGG